MQSNIFLLGIAYDTALRKFMVTFLMTTPALFHMLVDPCYCVHAREHSIRQLSRGFRISLKIEQRMPRNKERGRQTSDLTTVELRETY